MVYGDRKPHLVGLVVPDAEWLQEWATANGKPGGLEELCDDEDLRKMLDEAVGRINKRVSNLERVRRFTIAPRPFTIENEQMTPKMTIRRHVISSEYGEALEAMY
jgi:long-chain acyl-CoA synthetase